jgi:hypothetical protein
MRDGRREGGRGKEREKRKRKRRRGSVRGTQVAFAEKH